MELNGAKAVNCTWPSIPRVTCWPHTSPQPVNKTALMSRNWHSKPKKSPSNASRSFLWTRLTPATRLTRPTHKPLVVKLPDAKHGFILLPRRRVVERSFGWMARFRRLALDYERLLHTLKGLHFSAFAVLNVLLWLR